MAKSAAKTNMVFFCTECGYESKKWMGQCPGCKNWNTFSEEPSVPKSRSHTSSGSHSFSLSEPVHLNDIASEGEERIPLSMDEFDRVLGGGIVPGSVILTGGEPGIGKSTLLLQTALDLADHGRRILYVSGEESLRQIKLRADRIGTTSGDLRFLSSINIDSIVELLEKEKPDLCIIDSIQTMMSDDVPSAAGSVTQVKECAQKLTLCAKANGISVFLVGHVTKDGTVAGPRILEHMVDTVLYFESSVQNSYRMLRSAKNRFGSTNEVGIFEMTGQGLTEVRNPSEFMLEGRPENASGSVVTCLFEGTRPMLLEVQGLVTETVFNIARRQALGLDYNRLSLLLAVLEKRGGLRIGGCDAYVNIAGGMKVTEPAADLAVIASVISSYRNKIIPSDMLVFGEVGLSGEVRGVSQAYERIKEAAKLGFHQVILPQANIRTLPKQLPEDIKITGIRYITELFSII